MNDRMRVLIAYDGSASAKQALNELRRAGLPQQTEALIVSACDMSLLPDPGSASNASAPQARAIAIEIEAIVADA